MLLASLWAASSSRSRSLSSRGDRACVQPSNNQHSREAHSPLLLLFTTVYFLPLPTSRLTSKGHNAAPVTFCAGVENGCRVMTDNRDETDVDNAASAGKIDVCASFSLCDGKIGPISFFYFNQNNVCIAWLFFSINTVSQIKKSYILKAFKTIFFEL